MATSAETFLNPEKFKEELTSMLKQYKLPGIELDAVIAGQRKNVEALTDASRAAFEGTQAIGRRQAEILQETMDETAKAFDSLSKAGSPSEVAAKQAELAKEAFEKALGNMREVAELVTNAQQAVMDTVNARFSQSLDELKQMAMEMKEPSAKEKVPTAEAPPASA